MVAKELFRKFGKCRSTLIFRGTDHGMTSEAFHRQCDRKGSYTVTIIETVKGQIFGGFTTQDWEQGSIYKDDEEAFLFSIDLGLTFPILDKRDAIFCDK